MLKRIVKICWIVLFQLLGKCQSFVVEVRRRCPVRRQHQVSQVSVLLPFVPLWRRSSSSLWNGPRRQPLRTTTSTTTASTTNNDEDEPTKDETPWQVKPQDDEQEQQPMVVEHCIRWTTAEGTVTFKAYDGEILRTAALRRGIVSPHNGKATLINCRGLGTCGTCAVQVMAAATVTSDSTTATTSTTTTHAAPSVVAAAASYRSGPVQPRPPVEPMERNTRERIRLSFPPHNSNNNNNKQSTPLRLACQIQVRGDLDVIKYAGFWGQSYDSLAPSSQHETYLGDWEYLLDAKSPSSPPTPNME